MLLFCSFSLVVLSKFVIDFLLKLVSFAGAEALAAEWLQTDANSEGMRCYCALMIYARREEFHPDTERLRALAEDATLPLTLRTAAHQLLPLNEEDHEQ
jgi:hypothetical protein